MPLQEAYSLSGSGVSSAIAAAGIGLPPPQQLHSLPRATVRDPTHVTN